MICRVKPRPLDSNTTFEISPEPTSAANLHGDVCRRVIVHDILASAAAGHIQSLSDNNLISKLDAHSVFLPPRVHTFAHLTTTNSNAAALTRPAVEQPEETLQLPVRVTA